MSEKVVCFCNGISISKVEKAINEGASNLPEIYDATGAGTGPCGGSCRNRILQLLVSKAPNQTESVSAPELSAPLELVEAVSLFNRRYYWETHEVLEKVWMDEHGPLKKFFQGLIQASAALYHVLNANPKGVIRLAEEAAAKLRTFAPAQMGIPLEDLIHSLENYAEEARQILGNTRSGFDYDALPYLLLGKDMDVPPAFKK